MEDLTTLKPDEIRALGPASANAALAVIDRIEHDLKLVKVLLGSHKSDGRCSLCGQPKDACRTAQQEVFLRG